MNPVKAYIIQQNLLFNVLGTGRRRAVRDDWFGHRDPAETSARSKKAKAISESSEEDSE